MSAERQGLIVAEASRRVGYGHLMECLAVANEIDTGKVVLSEEFLDSNALELARGKGFEIHTSAETAEHRYEWILLDTRKNDIKIQRWLRKKTERLVVIDELGGIELDCDAVVNFSIVEQWRSYKSRNPPKRYFGPEYFPLRQSIKTSFGTEKKKGRIIVSLGGADRTETILEVARNARHLSNERLYVLGPGCSIATKKVSEIDPDGKVLTAPDNYDDLLASAEFVICAGGNTLYEASFSRTFPLVVWEDPHEKIQGERFEAVGAAIVIGGAGKVHLEKLKTALERQHAKSAAPSIIDGWGALRVAEIVAGKTTGRL